MIISDNKIIPITNSVGNGHMSTTYKDLGDHTITDEERERMRLIPFVM